MSHILDVYLHERFVGKLIQGNNGRLQFQYNEQYVVSTESIPISLSMPVQLEQYEEPKVRAFFSGLLPDDIARHRLARYLGVSEKNPFSLLEAIGGECAGALALYPEGQIPVLPKIGDIEKLHERRLREILNLLKQRPLLASEDNVRLSLAGAQDKLAVTLVDNSVALVKGTTPTTHILKPLIEGVKDSVYNELFCLRLAAQLNIETPQAEIRWVEDTPYFLVERYDRQIDLSKKITRLHQEDFCQVLSVLPELKYEREGGPSVLQSLQLLHNYSLQPAADRRAFTQRLIFNYLIGNADAHGKNYSMLFAGKQPRLAPAYDLLSTVIYPNLSMKMAMKIGGKYDPDDVLLRHWYRIIPDTAPAKRTLNKDLIKMSKDCVEQSHTLKTTLKAQGMYSTIFEDICHVIKKRAEYILGQF